MGRERVLGWCIEADLDGGGGAVLLLMNQRTVSPAKAVSVCVSGGRHLTRNRRTADRGRGAVELASFPLLSKRRQSCVLPGPQMDLSPH